MIKNKAPTAQASSRIYGKVFDYMLEGCQLIGRDFRYLYLNDIAAKQGKQSPQDLIGRTMMECYPGIDRTPMFTLLSDCLRTKVAHSMENQFTFPDGSSGWFELRIEPIPEGAMILSLDITERKLAEERMQQLDELKSTFIKIASHQLRTPLTTISWNLEQVLDAQGELKLPAKYHTAISLAYRFNNVVSSRLRDLLRALDIEEQNISLQKTPTDIRQLLNAVVHNVPDKLARHRVHLADAKKTPLVLNIDPEKIADALMRLIDNALVYSAADKPVEVRLKLTPRLVKIEVEDQGIGIPAQAFSHIFSRFYRASNAPTQEPNASGLGLYLAKHSVELHGGTLGFWSHQGKGSLFWISLPRK